MRTKEVIVINDFEKLKSIAEKAGYKTTYDAYSGSHINHTRKVITAGVRLTEEETAKYAHEIGHLYGHRVGKYCRVLAECGAWVIGFIVCQLAGVRIKGYWRTAKECLKTYIGKL